MAWTPQELERLRLLVDRLAHDLGHPTDLAVACSRRGDLAFDLARRFAHTRIVGFELDPEALTAARRRSNELGFHHRVEFAEAELRSIPLPSGRFGGLVSDFVLYPTTMPTEFGQTEIERVLKPGGTALITDVVAEGPLEAPLRLELQKVGIDYLGDANRGDFRRWLSEAGLIHVCIEDLTPLVRPIWEARAARDSDPMHRLAHSALLDRELGLGAGVFYVYVRGKKPQVAAPRRRLTAVA